MASSLPQRPNKAPTGIEYPPNLSCIYRYKPQPAPLIRFNPVSATEEAVVVDGGLHDEDAQQQPSDGYFSAYRSFFKRKPTAMAY
nr:hypothetical protein Itr_chr12CG18700 [Ipomoea trifida]